MSVMDNIADPNITFDENGICNYYYEYLEAEKQHVLKGEAGEAKFNEIVARIKADGKEKKYDLAIEAYSKAIELKNDYYIAYNNRGTTKLEKTDLDAAIKDFNKAIELNKDYAYAYNNRSYVHYKKKNYKESIADCDKAIFMNDKYGEAYLNRGISKEMMKDFKGACDDFHKANGLGISRAKQYFDVCE